MSVVITTYTLASGLMQQGMTWWQAMLTILLGNAIVLVPMILNAHAGTKYGVSFPGAVPRQLRRAGARTCRRSCARSSRAAGSASRRGSAASRCNTLLAAAWPGVGRAAAGQRLDRVRASSGLIQVVAHRPRPRGHQEARELVGAAAARRRRAAARLGDPPRRRARPHPRANRSRLQTAHTPFWQLFPAGADRQRRLLGDAQPEHSRLHALRAQPALAGARPGARPAGDDDGVRVHRRGGDERDDRHLRRGDLGSGRADRAHRQRRRSSSSARWSCCWRS